jgi:dienelactone hydrolase
VKEFFTSEAALKAAFEKHSRQSAFNGRTGKEAQAWQRRARKKFSELLGLHLFRHAPARAKLLGRVRLDGGLIREEWRMQTEPNVWMPYYLFVPAQKTSAPRPLVLCLHGHVSAGKWAPGGRTDIPALRDTIQRHNYDYGVQLARAGFITACPDARGFGERREPAQQHDRRDPSRLTASSCHNLMLAGSPLGFTVQGMWTWDLMRLLDHLSTDPRIDAARAGCAGLSGGGMQSLNLAALDTRIKAAVVSGYFYGVRESLQIQNGNCACNLVPHLWEHFDMGDIGALAAPRGLFIETGDTDPLNGKSLRNVTSQVALSRKVYKALDAARMLTHHVFSGPHLWCGTRAIPWLCRHLEAGK